MIDCPDLSRRFLQSDYDLSNGDPMTSGNSYTNGRNTKRNRDRNC
jgi:hypothetical protein